MSEPNYAAYPGRTPVFTTLVVLAGFAAFVGIGYKFYVPTRTDIAPNPADFAEEQRWRHTPEGRAKHLADLRAREQAAATTYGWVDREHGVVRLPIDEAIKLTAREFSEFSASGGKLK